MLKIATLLEGILTIIYWLCVFMQCSKIAQNSYGFKLWFCSSSNSKSIVYISLGIRDISFKVDSQVPKRSTKFLLPIEK